MVAEVNGDRDSVMSGQGIFVGRFTHSLDPKKRLTIPAVWRAQVGTPKSLYVLPDFHLYAVSGAVHKNVSVHGEFFTWGYVGYAAGYGLVYISIMLLLTILRFRRKDFV